ncbi:MAG: hypothetical protein AAF686_01840 [Pseudomonadota bacterium]
MTKPALACDWVATLSEAHATDVPADLPAAQTAHVICSARPDLVCQWSFDYRSAAANALFGHISADLVACLGPAKALEPGVNHPDSYQLRQFEAPERLISLSLKDKASLEQSFVFLRVDKSQN